MCSSDLNDKILDSVWFTPMGGACIGIVMVETQYDGPVFYIGVGAGVNQQTDARHIASTGARFPWNAGAEIFGQEIEK